MGRHLYDDERLARLLSLFRPAPQAWVMQARGIFVDSGVGDTPAPTARQLTDSDVASLRHALEVDLSFRQRFDADPVAAARAAGMDDLAAAIGHEMHELVALAERVARDGVLRVELGTAPVGALTAAGFPEAAALHLLSALDLQDETDALLPDVVAHEHEPQPPRSQLLIMLLGSTAVADRIHAALRDA